MTNNDMLRRLRYSLDLSDSKMINIFAQAEQTMSREEISNWLKKDDDPAYSALGDLQFAQFLNGLIAERRGKREGPAPVPEKHLSNNMIFMKLKIALDLKSEDVLEILALNHFSLSSHELSAFFRKPAHKHYRKCKDQVLRNFLKGLQLKLRGDSSMTEQFEW